MSAVQVHGSCVCGTLQYRISVDSPDEARTTLCHCSSCQKAFGTNFGLTTKVSLRSFQYVKGTPEKYTHDNGVTREFCKTCGVFICEYGDQSADKFRYMLWGTMSDPDRFPPKGEFFCKSRAKWMPEIPGLFHKAEIHD